MIDAQCRNKVAVFTRVRGLVFKPPDAKKVAVISREECQDR